MLIIAHSRNCLQPRSWPRSPSSSAERLPIRGSWDQNQCSTWQGKWAYQPLPLDVHPPLRSVRTRPTPHAIRHFTNSLDRSGHFLEYLLTRNDVKDAWKAHTEHEFVQGIADGTLPVEKFKYYLIQDYLFLVSAPPLASFQQVPSKQPQLISLSRYNSPAPKP